MTRVDFLGESFDVADEVSDFAMMEYADAVARGGEAQAASAMYVLLQDIIPEADWPRFRQHALRKRATIDQLGDVVAAAFGQTVDRPTERPGDSSSGPQATPAASTDAFSSRVIAREEARGRPDRALMVSRASQRATA